MDNLQLQQKYRWTSKFYDLLDLPWELQYKKWRPTLINDLRGRVLEAGVGTGRNLSYYDASVDLLGIDLSQHMIQQAQKRAKKAHCSVSLACDDATQLTTVDDASCDWVLSTFMCCVMPDHLQPKAIHQFSRVLKMGGKFRLLEMVFSNNPTLLKRQQRFAKFVEKVYGARFDRKTKSYIEANPHLKITRSIFLKDDTYLLIEGKKIL
jgi:ubiquinone/menaquinone biosynthesis C-methylase UbiE